MKQTLSIIFVLLGLLGFSFGLPFISPAWFSQGVIIFLLIICILLLTVILDAKKKHHED